jgi:DNA-binding PadR family transcriptional regulator
MAMKQTEGNEFAKTFENLSMELRRGTVVLSVLSQLQEPQYGYSLVEVLREKGIPVEAGTLYPLLRRLESQQLLESMWDTDGTKPRKYYALTKHGRDMLELLSKEWQDVTKSMIGLLRQE